MFLFLFFSCICFNVFARSFFLMRSSIFKDFLWLLFKLVWYQFLLSYFSRSPTPSKGRSLTPFMDQAHGSLPQLPWGCINSPMSRSKPLPAVGVSLPSWVGFLVWNYGTLCLRSYREKSGASKRHHCSRCSRSIRIRADPVILPVRRDLRCKESRRIE